MMQKIFIFITPFNCKYILYISLQLKNHLKIATAREQFPALTGLRAIAAFMVFFHHLPFMLKPGVLIGLQLTFYTGVSIFFVLSGFLITYRYHTIIQLSGKWVAQYFINRFARIYPVYFLVLTIVLLSGHRFDFIYLLQNYTLTANIPFMHPHGLAISPAWSLVVEESFYLLMPAIVLFALRYGLRAPFIVSCILLVSLLCYYHSDAPMRYYVLLNTFFGHFMEFYAGIFLAFILLYPERYRKIHSIKYKTSLGVIGFCILTIPLIYVSNRADIRHMVMIPVNNFLLPFPVTLLIWGLATENSLLSRIISGRSFMLAGKSSYAFYLLHLPLIELFARPYIQKYFPAHWYNVFVLLVFCTCFGLSVIIYTCYERPVNIMIRQKFRSLLKKESALLHSEA
jgi:peptidoglycan/LPS O-acetylase OafA/YrhL